MTQGSQKNKKPNMEQQLLLNFEPSSFHPSLSTGLALQADHVPEFHRSSSSHSLRSCSLLRLQCQQAALPLVVVYSSFFSIFLKDRGARGGCYHHTCFHSATSLLAVQAPNSNSTCSALSCSALSGMTLEELGCICSSVLKSNSPAETAKFQSTANSYNRAVTLQNRDC